MAIFAIYQNRSYFALLDTLKNRHCLDSLPKTNWVDPGLNLEIFSLQIYGDSAMRAILFYIGREDQIMSIQHFLFEWDSEKYEHFLSNIPVIQIPEIGETCITVFPWFLVYRFFLLLFLCMILFFFFCQPLPPPPPINPQFLTPK